MIMNKALKMSIEELSRRFDAKLASLNASDSVEKINSLFTSGVENNRITRPKAGEFVISCKEALEQPTQEPVAWVEYAWVTDDDGLQSPQKILHDYENFRAVPLYTHPKEWQRISQYEIKDISDELGFKNKDDLYEFARAIEAKLKEKNG